MSSLARETFLHREERRRRGLAWGGALALYLVAALAILLQGIFGRETFSMNSGPIQIRIGTPEGLDETSRVLPALKAASDTPPSPAVPASPPPPPTPEPKAQTTVQAPKPAPVAPAKTPVPVAPEVSMPPTRLAKDPGAPDSGAVGVPSGYVGGTGSTSLKGSEAGNSFETNLGGGSSIGRALFVPIYLYMPLPLVVPDSVYKAITASPDGFISRENRQLQFRSHYELAGDRWRQSKADVPYKDRPGLWAVLESGGFDLSLADYKRGNSLRPVILDFELNPYDQVTRSVSLKSVEIRSGSGDRQVDDAVVYGFRQGSYSNGSGKVVRATFTYRFD